MSSPYGVKRSSSVSSSTNISLTEILENKLLSHSEYDSWSDRLESYLEQEGLLHIIRNDTYVNLGVNVTETQRAEFVDHMLSEAKVRYIILSTVPLQFFKDNRDRSAHDLMYYLAMECGISAIREEGDQASLHNCQGLGLSNK